MIVATVNSKGYPEAAFVGFAEASDLSLIFGTNSTSRKYQNIQQNKHVAIVFGGEKGITVQYEGEVSVLGGETLVNYKKIYFTKTPESQKYENNLHQVYFKVEPTWLRYTDFTKEEAEIFELLPTAAATTTKPTT